jgi:Kae1-associated kinase Bud32
MKLAQGAEAIITKDNTTIIKERFSKAYRLSHLDHSLRQFRTRREAKVLGKLNDLNFPAPRVQEFSDKRMSIVMDFVPGEKLKDVLLKSSDFANYAEQIGQNVAKLHQENIIHGDLTTSNMIVDKNTHKLHFIDFGLSAFSDALEDKAVDLFLLDRSLEATHFEHYPEIFARVIEGYDYPGCKQVLERLQAVKKRGRNKK